MKKLFVLVVVCLLLVSLSYLPRVYANEVLKVTRDHFEFRDAPRVDEETLIGTLRIDTPVEWTGNVSDGWLEVKAPNGQIGWVHESGLSRPKTPVKQRQISKTPPPASPSASQSSSAQVSKLQASIKELEKAKDRYEAQLTEKDRRIQELSEELGQLEEKLSDTGQMLEDQAQMRTLNERKVTEAENELLALQGMIKEKDEALLTAKVEMTRLENQVQNFGAQQASPLSPERVVFGLSLLVNLLGFLLFLTMRKRLSVVKEGTPEIIREDGDMYQERPEAQKPEKKPLADTIIEGSPEIVPEPQSENDDRFKELDVVMTAPHLDDETIEEADSSDDVEIDLGDVLPTAVAMRPEGETSELEDAGLSSVSDAEVIIVEEPIERIDDLDEQPVTEAVVEELPLEEEDVTEAVFEELPEKPAEKIQEMFSEEKEELLEVEEDLDAESEELVKELLLEDEELLDVEEGEELVDESDIAEISVEELEVSGEIFEKLPKSATQRIESEAEDTVSFDEKNEQLSEESSEENGDDVIIGNPGMIDEDDYDNDTSEFESSPETKVGNFEPEDSEYLDEGVADEELAEAEALAEDVPEELLEAEELDEEELLEIVDTQPVPQEFEVEEIVLIEDEDDQVVSKALHDEREERSIEDARDISSEVEELLELEDVESVHEQQLAPSFLEPSPFLIEPEHEPEELVVTGEEELTEGSFEEPATEKGYNIELLDAGKNKENVIHVLSKVNGLLASPGELVENAPCLIAKGAVKNDAESFQLIMQKMGATVRVIPQA